MIAVITLMKISGAYFCFCACQNMGGIGCCSGMFEASQTLIIIKCTRSSATAYKIAVCVILVHSSHHNAILGHLAFLSLPICYVWDFFAKMQCILLE